jgi:hypothetical protein
VIRSITRTVVVLLGTVALVGGPTGQALADHDNGDRCGCYGHERQFRGGTYCDQGYYAYDHDGYRYDRCDRYYDDGYYGDGYYHDRYYYDRDRHHGDGDGDGRHGRGDGDRGGRGDGDGGGRGDGDRGGGDGGGRGGDD